MVSILAVLEQLRPGGAWTVVSLITNIETNTKYGNKLFSELFSTQVTAAEPGRIRILLSKSNLQWKHGAAKSAWAKSGT